jgi:hypothetical protein
MRISSTWQHFGIKTKKSSVKLEIGVGNNGLGNGVSVFVDHHIGILGIVDPSLTEIQAWGSGSVIKKTVVLSVDGVWIYRYGIRHS